MSGPAKYPSWEPDYRKAWRKHYRAIHQAEINAARLAYYHRNREAINAKAAARYRLDAAFRERAKARAKLARIKNPEHYKQVKADYRYARKEELAAAQLRRYYRNHSAHLALHAKYREQNRPRQRAFARAKSATISDQYVREQLSKYSMISMSEWPPELVEAKRLQIRLKRMTLSKRKQKLTQPHEERN